jgi:hypothetical protein
MSMFAYRFAQHVNTAAAAATPRGIFTMRGSEPTEPRRTLAAAGVAVADEWDEEVGEEGEGENAGADDEEEEDQAEEVGVEEGDDDYADEPADDDYQQAADALGVLRTAHFASVRLRGAAAADIDVTTAGVAVAPTQSAARPEIRAVSGHYSVPLPDAMVLTPTERDVVVLPGLYARRQ